MTTIYRVVINRINAKLKNWVLKTLNIKCLSSLFNIKLLDDEIKILILAKVETISYDTAVLSLPA